MQVKNLPPTPLPEQPRVGNGSTLYTHHQNQQNPPLQGLQRQIEDTCQAQETRVVIQDRQNRK